MERPLLIGFGGCVVDELYKAPPELRASTQDMFHSSTPASLISCNMGGVARNVVDVYLAAAAQSAKVPPSDVSLVSVVGDDREGRAMIAAMGAKGVDVGGIQLIRGAQTAKYLAILDSFGELTAAAANMGIFNTGFNAEIIGRHLREALSRRSPAAPVVLFVDGNVPGDVVGNVMSSLRNSDNAAWSRVTVMADPISRAKCSNVVKYIRHIDVLKPNNYELEVLAAALSHDDTTLVACDAAVAAGTSKKPLSENALVRLCQQRAETCLNVMKICVKQQHFPRVFTSLGPRGVLVSVVTNVTANNERQFGHAHLPALPVDMNRSESRVTGAGDSFCAGVVSALLGGRIRLSPDAVLRDAAKTAAVGNEFAQRTLSGHVVVGSKL